MRRSQLDGLHVIEGVAHRDDRGYFTETYNERVFDEAVGAATRFVQDNESESLYGVIRGLHYQVSPHAQGKLVRALAGRIFDVAVDLRRSSPTIGDWFGIELLGSDTTQLWIPQGFAHGFMVLSSSARVAYKTTDFYAPSAERTIRWDDPAIDIEWPSLAGEASVVVSDKDRLGSSFYDAELFE